MQYFNGEVELQKPVAFLVSTDPPPRVESPRLLSLIIPTLVAGTFIEQIITQGQAEDAVDSMTNEEQLAPYNKN